MPSSAGASTWPGHLSYVSHLSHLSYVSHLSHLSYVSHLSHLSRLRRVSALSAYRDRQGQWAWLLHRVSGLGVLLFLCLHVVDTSMLLAGEAAYNHLIRSVYQQWWFQPMEIALGGALLYHALNGLRLILIDVWEDAIVYRRRLLQGVVALFVVAMVPLTLLMIWPFVTGQWQAVTGQ